MKSATLGVVIHAIGLPKELARVRASVEKLLPLPFIDLSVEYITEANFDASDLGKLNVAHAKNIGIRRLLNKCETICCLDADYLVPPGLFELAAITLEVVGLRQNLERPD